MECPAHPIDTVLDEDKDTTEVISDEDDEDTAQRPAIKIASAEVPLAPLASVSLNGHHNHQAEVVEIEGKDTVVSNESENVVEIEVPESTANDTELTTVDVQEDQKVEVVASTDSDTVSEIVAAEEDEGEVATGNRELEDEVVKGDISANVEDEEVVDSIQLAIIEPVDVVGEEEIEEDRDDSEEKLDANTTILL